MKTIKGNGIKNVMYQFNRPISAIDIYGSIEEFNSVYPKVESIIDKRIIKKLEKEYIHEVKKSKDFKTNKDYYYQKMYGFVTMRIEALLDAEVNLYTDYIDIKYDAYNQNIYAVGKKDSYVMTAKFDYEEKSKIIRNLKRSFQAKVGKTIREMLS